MQHWIYEVYILVFLFADVLFANWLVASEILKLCPSMGLILFTHSECGWWDTGNRTKHVWVVRCFIDRNYINLLLVNTKNRGLKALPTPITLSRWESRPQDDDHPIIRSHVKFWLLLDGWSSCATIFNTMEQQTPWTTPSLHLFNQP